MTLPPQSGPPPRLSLGAECFKGGRSVGRDQLIERHLLSLVPTDQWDSQRTLWNKLIGQDAFNGRSTR